MKILSFGAGAIGTYIGGSLALRGHQLVFVEQAEAAEKLKKTGLKLNLAKAVGQDAEADFSLQSPEVYFASSLEEALSFGPFDIALFALKSYDTDSALEGMRPFIKQLPPILCLQNGIDNEPALASILGENNVIPATVTSAVGRRGVGEIILEKLRGVGIANTHTLSQQLYQAFLEAGLNPRMYQKSADMKWSKMLTNLLANPTSAILNMSPAEVFANDGLYRLEIAQLSECLAVMKSQSINVVDLPG
ncbi:MAG: 2-dehydropantoate 2-reductase N-terminal domain-containing protein, partial [Chloroflexota bacterium]